MMKKADIPPAPRRGHSSSRQTLKQKLDRTRGMRLLYEEEQGPKSVVHQTSSATQIFFGSLSGLRQLANKSSRSWLIRDSSVPADLNGLDTESNASSFGSVSGFGSRFGSAIDMAGLVGLEDLALSGSSREVGSQGSNSIFLQAQLERGSRRNSLEGGFTLQHCRRNSLEGFAPRHCDGDEQAFGLRDNDNGSEQFALEGVVVSTGCLDEGTMQCNVINVADQGSTRISSQVEVPPWRKFGHVQVEDKIRAIVKIQSWWRSYKQRQFYQSLLQYRIDCATRIQRRWRRIRILQNLILERWSRERVVTVIQAHFKGMKVRMWLKRRRHAVLCIESAYWSYAQRKPPKKLPIEREMHVCEQSSKSLQTCVVGTCLVDDNYLPMLSLKESTLCGSNSSLDTFSPNSPLSAANSYVHSNSSETHNNDCGYISSQCSVLLMEDWNNVPIDELDQCLDTCLAALPLSVASSRQRYLASSRQCSSTFDVVLSSSFLDHLDTATSSDLVLAPPIERTPAPASLKSSEVQQGWVGVGEVYGGTASETIKSGSEISSPLLKLYPSPSQELLVNEESAIMVEQGEKSIMKSKDDERLQHFAEIFLTMRQISLQQQRAQSAPPFPPSLAPLSSPTPPQSPPIIEAGPVVEVSSTRRSRNSRCVSVPLPPTPATSTDQAQVSSQRTDVVLNMEELLKTLEQYCEDDFGGCNMVIKGDLESGQNWRVRKTRLNMTSTPTLGIKHLKLLDVNAVLIVLVAIVVYTRTVCGEVFFGTRHKNCKN